MVTTKVYKGFGKGETLMKAIWASSTHTPHIVEEWIESQGETYLTEDYDFERIYDIIWDFESQALINFFTKIGHTLDNEIFTSQTNVQA